MSANRNIYDLDANEIVHREDAMKNSVGYRLENIVEHTNRFQIRIPATPKVDYIRVCDPDGGEIAYWDIQELRDDPALVLGALVGAVIR